MARSCMVEVLTMTMTWKVVYHETETTMKQLCECTEYDNAVIIAGSLRESHVAHGKPDAHFGVVKGDFLRWSTKPSG